MVVRTHYRRPRRHGSRLYIAVWLFGCIVIGARCSCCVGKASRVFLRPWVWRRPCNPVTRVCFAGYHMMVGLASYHHRYSDGGSGGKGGMYSAGRMDALMERQDGAHGTLRRDTPDSTQSVSGSSRSHHVHMDEKRGKKIPVPVIASPAPPQSQKSPMSKKEEAARQPQSTQKTKQYSSKAMNVSMRREGMQPISHPFGGAKNKNPPLSCRIHVWDAEKMAPDLGLSACNISDIWPFDHPGSGIDGMYRTAHQNAPHAIGYWLAEAVRKSAAYEEKFDRADLILLNTYVTSR